MPHFDEDTGEVTDYASMLDAVRSDDYMGTLLALRDYLGRRLDEPLSGRDVAPTAKALMEVLDAIETIRAEDNTDEAEKIASDMNAKIANLRIAK